MATKKETVQKSVDAAARNQLNLVSIDIVLSEDVDGLEDAYRNLDFGYRSVK